MGRRHTVWTHHSLAAPLPRFFSLKLLRGFLFQSKNHKVPNCSIVVGLSGRLYNGRWSVDVCVLAVHQQSAEPNRLLLCTHTLPQSLLWYAFYFHFLLLGQPTTRATPDCAVRAVTRTRHRDRSMYLSVADGSIQCKDTRCEFQLTWDTCSGSADPKHSLQWSLSSPVLWTYCAKYGSMF